MKSSRRSFIKKTAVAGSGIIAAPTIISASVFGANDRINAAVLGIHGRGKNHISSLMELENVRVATLCDPDMNLLTEQQKTFKEKYGTKVKLEQDLRRERGHRAAARRIYRTGLYGTRTGIPLEGEHWRCGHLARSRGHRLRSLDGPRGKAAVHQKPGTLQLALELALRQRRRGQPGHPRNGPLYVGARRGTSNKDHLYGRQVPLGRCQGDPGCLLYTSPSPRDGLLSRMPSS